jgi:hypothetical protein
MQWFYLVLVIVCLVSIAINSYIIYYQVEHHTAWFFITASAFGLFFGLFRLFTSTKSFFGPKLL